MKVTRQPAGTMISWPCLEAFFLFSEFCWNFWKGWALLYTPVVHQVRCCSSALVYKHQTCFYKLLDFVYANVWTNPLSSFESCLTFVDTCLTTLFFLFLNFSDRQQTTPCNTRPLFRISCSQSASSRWLNCSAFVSSELLRTCCH